MASEPQAYADVTQAVKVAKATGARLIQADASLCKNLKAGEVGYLLAPNGKDLYDEAGKCWHVRVRCHRVEKGEPGTPEYRPGKFELFLEEKVDG